MQGFHFCKNTNFFWKLVDHTILLFPGEEDKFSDCVYSQKCAENVEVKFNEIVG